MKINRSRIRNIVREVLDKQETNRQIMTESKHSIEQLVRREVMAESISDLIAERMFLASVNDITSFKPEIRNWAEALVDELEKRAARMKDMTEKRRTSIINSLVSVAVKDLIRTTGSMTSQQYSRT